MQTACLRAFERFAGFRAGSDFRAWIFTILRNEFVSGWRRERRHVGAERVLLLLPKDCGPDLEEVLIEQQWSDEVRAALVALPETYRVPVFLKDVAGFAYREIAEVAACPLGTVMSRLARGRALLRATLLRQARERGIVGGRPAERAVR